MSYYDAEIMVKDVNPINSRFFEEGWLYVGSLKNQEAPVYFAPYFTGKGANSGISMISRVVGARAVILADTHELSNRPQTSSANGGVKVCMCSGNTPKQQGLPIISSGSTFWISR